MRDGWKNLEAFKVWLEQLARIQSRIWESDWEFAVKFMAHELIGTVASAIIERKESPA